MITIEVITKKEDGEDKVRQFELGEPGNLILIKGKGRDSYRIGLLKGIGERKYSGNGKSPIVDFEGISYNLEFLDDFLGKKIVNFRPSSEDRGYVQKKIGKVVVGRENIVSYLGKVEDGKYEDHVKYFKKISKFLDL